MRFLKLSSIPCLAVIASCQPGSPGLTESTPIPARIPETPDVSAPKSAIPRDTTTIPIKAPIFSRKVIAGITFEGVAFDSRTHRLRVIDQTLGPGSRYGSSRDVAEKRGALLAINAGFFTPGGEPLGLVVSDGTTSGAWNSASSLGSGIYRESGRGVAEILRRRSRQAVSGARELLQSGPLLVEMGEQVTGLDSGKTAARSLIMTDGETRWWVGISSPCTLRDLGSTLSRLSPAKWKPKTALNLDGGRSTDLFVSENIPGGPVNRRGFLNKPVRNFFILERK